MTRRIPAVCMAFVLLVSGSLGSTLLGQQSESRGPTQARMSSEEVLRLSLQWVDFLALLNEVRDLEATHADVQTMLINNRLSVNKLQSPFLTGDLWSDAHSPTDSTEQLTEQIFIKTVQVFRLNKVALTNRKFALLKQVSEATSVDDVRTLQSDVAVVVGEDDALWRQLPLTASALSHVFVDSSRVVDDRTPYLRLTSQHITTLRQRLKEVFPGIDESFAEVFTASLLYDFLDSGYKPAAGMAPAPPLPTIDSSVPPAVRIGGAIKPPTKTKDVPPHYPLLAQGARITGVVILEVTIAPNGRVADARVLRSIPLLDDAALDAVRQWEFSPTLLDGVAVPVIMTVTANFQLD